ncbi:MAG: hypothetical protein ACSHX7_13970 [Luteolibacter sp.]
MNLKIHTKCGALFLYSLIFQAIPLESADAIVHNNDNYGYIYWEHGYPTLLTGRRPQSAANTYARANPNLIVQTGYYSLRLDCDDAKLTGFDSLNGTDYISALNQDVTSFTSATMNLFVYKDGVRYRCTSGIVEQAGESPSVRLIENGQYVQRFDHMGLVFEDSSGNQLGVAGRLEVTAWPDRVGLQLDFIDVPGVTRTTIQLITPNGTQLLKDTLSDHVFLLMEPQNQQAISSPNASSWITAAYEKDTNTPLVVDYSEEKAAIQIDVPATTVSYPQDADRVDEYIIEVKNPYGSQQNVPIVFEQPTPRAITGTLMVLCNENDGSPTGHQVQLSKNWHTSEDVIHKGSWLRGSTMLTMAANETKRFRLRVIYGYWGGAGTVSHSQLSLIGYGGNWKWDESALGSWGESMTFDPTQHIAGAFLADVRPGFTTPLSANSTSHNWTENAGGGDFLIYYDDSNKFRWLKRVKTAYKWTGPNVTEVLYSGVADDDKIRANYSSVFVRTNDYHRRFFDYKYEFLDDVSPSRLVFFQMAADYYTGAPFENYYRGHSGGMFWNYTASPGGDTYQAKMHFSGRWLAINDTDTSSGSEKYHSHRGLIDYGTTLNGASFTAYIHPYGRSWGADKLLFDLSSDSTTRSYNDGDVVEGRVGLVMVPKASQDYWGEDAEFAGRLASYTDAWSGVYDEYRYNHDITVTASSGTIVRNYPLEISANNSSTVLAQFVINGNRGVGHVPIVLRDVDPGYGVRVQRNYGGWGWLEDVNIAQNNYYQGVMNANGKMDYCFNVDRPSSVLGSSWEIRILRGPAAN